MKNLSFLTIIEVTRMQLYVDYASLHKSSDCERLTVETTPLSYHHTPTRSMSPATSSVPTDLNPVDILKPFFFQFMANQQ